MMIPPETAVGEIGERGLLRHLQARIPLGPGVVVGVGDDAAAVELGPLVVVTADSLVEDVHFRRDWTPPRLLGRKALSVNLSDIAAMLASPRHATVSLCLPRDLPLAFVDGLYDGLLERAAETGVNLVGGNVSRSSSGIVIDVTVLGQATRVVRRAGAVPGDVVVVTGPLGGSAEGLKLLGQGARLDEEGNLLSTGVGGESAAAAVAAVAACLRAHLDPQPPLALTRALSDRELVHAAIDLSDGLSGDLAEMCQASGVSAVVDATAVPVDPNVTALTRSRGGDGLALALHGGEDYQLLFAVPPDHLAELRALAGIWDLTISVVGHFEKGPGTVMLKSPGELKPLLAASHDHFRTLAPAGEGGA
jgi:thiamine-monophosphate kinase